MRDDVVETTFDAMSPELRALIADDPNGALDVEMPQAALDEVRRSHDRKLLDLSFTPKKYEFARLRQARHLPLTFAVRTT